MPKAKQHKRVQTKPFTFQDWWDRQGYSVEHFKPCRAAWNAAQGRANAGVLRNSETGEGTSQQGIGGVKR